MILYNGRYSWDGKKHDGFDPIAWFPGAYYLRLFDLRTEQGRVELLKPFLCIYTKTGDGMSISEKPEKFAREICRKFGVELEKVLWVEELLLEPGGYEVVVYRKKGRIGDDFFYTTEKRAPLKGELAIIEKELAMAHPETA